MTGPFRLPEGGMIDRADRRGFSFDGHDYTGFGGDTLASALLANGVRLVGRSFKYHRPRGVLTAGSEEPNAMVEILDGPQKTPNTRATVQELYTGLRAQSQNRWPSLNLDLLAVNDLAAPFLSAGFYYKTFMWPRKFWEAVYEPLIRRAAGLGALSGQHDTARYEKAWAHCDLLVIGSGPAGLMAALAAGRSGADVILAEEDARMGGRLLSDQPQIDGQPGHVWATAVLAELASLPNVRLMPRTTVTGAYDDHQFGALERVALHVAPGTAPRECFWRIQTKRAILATGALERPLAFPMNDRPGVMMASAARSYAARYGVGVGKRVVVFANNDTGRETALALQAAGVNVVALVDPREDVSTLGDFTVYRGAQVVGSAGRKGLSHVDIRQGSNQFRLEADALLMAGGWNPTLHLTCHLNGRPEWNDQIAAFTPRPGAVPGLEAVGAAAGRFSTAQALSDGLRAAQTALQDMGVKRAALDVPKADDTPFAIAPLWAVDGKGRAWLDFANDVTTKDVKLAAQEGFRSVEHMKRYTTQGMAPDQGKSSNVAALAMLADATGQDIPATGTTTFRPPFVPVSIAAMGAGGRAEGFAPQRFLTSHEASVARGAPMIEAGLWYRPSYFPMPGETGWEEPCLREVRAVRNAVGVCDVSTLGKIDIKGRDAGRFLDLVYTNTFSTLPVGKVRYGLMLREDGFVMDDGTTARLGEHHFLMTTTTAAAGQVMRHLDFVHQAFCADWDVRFTSVTEHWTQFAIAGPKAREVLNAVLDEPLGDFPFMSCGSAMVSGVPGRVFRISFSGEVGYEVAVPARYGECLWGDLVSRAQALGGAPYGMEALNVLRIEKGFITHAEIHGRVTAFDIGLQGMVSGKKDCIGKAASQRPGLHGPEREQLVGIKPLEPGKRLSAGAHLFTAGETVTRANDQGYVTSVGPSPELGWIGLAFLKNGRARHGEMVHFVDHLRKIDMLVEVCNPVFLDPDGGKMRG